MRSISPDRYITRLKVWAGPYFVRVREWIDRCNAQYKEWVGFAVFAYGTIVAILVAAFVYHFHSLDGSTVDLDGFGLLSRNLAAGKGFSLGYGPTLRRAPLYPFLAAGILKIFGNYGVGVPDTVAYRPIIIAQCIVFGLTCLTVWALTRRLFGPYVALLAALLCPLVPQSLRYITMTEVESLVGLLTVLLAYTSLLFIERPRISTGVYLGLIVSAATLTKPVPEFYLILFLPCAWWYWHGIRARSSAAEARDHTRIRLIATGAALLFFALPLLPWTIRNWTVTDGQFFGISSNGPGEFLRGYVNVESKYFLLRQDYGGWDPEANDYEAAILQAHGAVFHHFGPFEGGTVQVSPGIPVGVTTARLEAQKDQIEGAVAKQQVVQHPLDFVRKFLIQLATFWYIVQSRTLSLLLGASALIFLGLSAVGVVHAARRGIMTWPTVFVIVYFNVVYAAILAFGRYSMPLYPTILVLAAAGLAALAPRVVALSQRVLVTAESPRATAIPSTVSSQADGE